MQMEAACFAHASMYKHYINACVQDAAIDHYDEAIDDPDEYLLSIVNAAAGIGLPDGHVPQATYFAIENNQILGAIRLRLGTNHFIENVIGHIGYEVQPLARNRGVAKQMLAWLLEYCVTSAVVISCGDDNRESQRVIASVGAQFLGEHDDDDFGKVLRFGVVGIE